jgi:hypothetical protein
MLVLSFALLATFICWQWYIEMRLHRPPLVRLALFTRGKGKLSVVYAFVVSPPEGLNEEPMLTDRPHIVFQLRFIQRILLVDGSLLSTSARTYPSEDYG